MTPKRAYEIGQALATKRGHGPDSTEEASKALALLWRQLNRAQQIIADLKDELDEREWNFEEGYWKGGPGIWCYCGAEGPASRSLDESPPEHRPTCGLKQGRDAANEFLARFGITED